LVSSVGDEALEDALQDRIDVLSMTKDSIEGDIGNEFLTP